MSAPPGSGKTVLIAQWATTRPHRRIAWLKLDAADDTSRVALHLVTALGRIGSPLPADLVASAGEGTARLGERFVDGFVQAAAALPATVLVIEDLDRVADLALTADIDLLLRHLPPSLHVVLTARGDPALGLHRLALRDELAQLRARDLRLTRDETDRLVRRLSGSELGEAQLDALVARTDGWVLGVQQAAIALRDGADPTSFVEGLTRSDHHLADYLTEEILDRQSTSVRSFLIETSPLDRLVPELCDEVLERTDSATVLMELERRGVFTNRADPVLDEYCYASLFRDLLRARLRATDPARRREVLVVAARWSAGRGDAVTAGQYLRRAGATEELFTLAARHSRRLYERDDIAAALQWLADAPNDGSVPADIRLVHAFLRMASGEQQRADAMLADLVDDRSIAEGPRAVALAFRSLLVQSVLAPSLAGECAERALAYLGQLGDGVSELPEVLGLTSRPTLTAVCHNGLGLAALYEGRLRDAREIFGRALSTDAATSPLLGVQVLGSAALADAWSGYLISASRHARRAEVVAEAAGVAGHRVLADVWLALAHVALRRRDLDAADAHLDAAATLAQSNSRHMVTTAVAIDRAALALAQGRPGAGLDLLARHAASGVPQPPAYLRARLTAVRARLHLAEGDRARARQVLADASGRRFGEQVHIATQLAAADGDWPLARKLVAGWPADDSRHGVQARSMWAAVIEHADGSRARGAHDMAAVAAEAEPDLDRALFLDAGPSVVGVLRALPRSSRSDFVTSIVDAVRVPAEPGAGPDGDLDGLSERELDVLQYLPTRLTNAEIAEHLYISLNTLKTHLKHVYRKLDVQRRRDAITAAERAGLL